MLYNINTGI